MLVLVGLLGSACLVGYLNTVKAQMSADQNYAQAQQVQAALLRIALEMQSASSVTVAGNVISYVNGEKRLISLSGSNLVLHTAYDGKDHVMADGVSSITASYANNLLSLSVTVGLSGGTTKQFTTAVYTP